MKNALLLFACGPADQLPGIIMSVPLLVSEFFSYTVRRVAEAFPSNKCSAETAFSGRGLLEPVFLHWGC